VAVGIAQHVAIDVKTQCGDARSCQGRIGQMQVDMGKPVALREGAFVRAIEAEFDQAACIAMVISDEQGSHAAARVDVDPLAQCHAQRLDIKAQRRIDIGNAQHGMRDPPRPVARAEDDVTGIEPRHAARARGFDQFDNIARRIGDKGADRPALGQNGRRDLCRRACRGQPVESGADVGQCKGDMAIGFPRFGRSTGRHEAQARPAVPPRE
jgi:hypothetical protein